MINHSERAENNDVTEKKVANLSQDSLGAFNSRGIMIAVLAVFEVPVTCQPWRSHQP